MDKPKKRRVIKFTCILACAVAYLWCASIKTIIKLLLIIVISRLLTAYHYYPSILTIDENKSESSKRTKQMKNACRSRISASAHVHGICKLQPAHYNNPTKYREKDAVSKNSLIVIQQTVNNSYKWIQNITITEIGNVWYWFLCLLFGIIKEIGFINGVDELSPRYESVWVSFLVVQLIVSQKMIFGS